MLGFTFNRIRYIHISRTVLVWAVGQDVGMASLCVIGHIIVFCMGSYLYYLVQVVN